MGLFSHRRRTSFNTQATPPKEKTDEEKALDYFDTEGIRCDSETDRDRKRAFSFQLVHGSKHRLTRCFHRLRSRDSPSDWMKAKK